MARLTSASTSAKGNLNGAALLVATPPPSPPSTRFRFAGSAERGSPVRGEWRLVFECQRGSPVRGGPSIVCHYFLEMSTWKSFYTRNGWLCNEKRCNRQSATAYGQTGSPRARSTVLYALSTAPHAEGATRHIDSARARLLASHSAAEAEGFTPPPLPPSGDHPAGQACTRRDG